MTSSSLTLTSDWTLNKSREVAFSTQQHWWRSRKLWKSKPYQRTSYPTKMRPVFAHQSKLKKVWNRMGTERQRNLHWVRVPHPREVGSIWKKCHRFTKTSSQIWEVTPREEARKLTWSLSRLTLFLKRRFYNGLKDTYRRLQRIM